MEADGARVTVLVPIQVRLDMTTWQLDRQHTFEVRAIGGSGGTNPNPATFTWTISIQPPTQTTITSAIDGNGNPVQNGGSTSSTSIKFQVTATAGTNAIAGFECSLDGSTFSTCARYQSSYG